MIRIEMNPNDQKDILDMLKYASEMKEQNKPLLKGSNKWDDSKYWIMRIEQLKEIVNGRNDSYSLYTSSLPTPMPTKEEKSKQKYQRMKLENDIFNGKDWYENNDF